MSIIIMLDVVILAGGQGNRLKPITTHTPKPLIEVCGKPMLQYLLEALPEDISHVIFVVHHLAHKIELFAQEYLEENFYTIAYQKQLSGTHDALKAAQGSLKNDNFLVVSGDDYYTKEDISAHIREPGITFGVQKRTMPSNYWSIQTDNSGYLSNFEKQNELELQGGCNIANGLYKLDQSFFNLTPVTLTDGEVGIPQTLLRNKDHYPAKVIQSKGWHPLNSHEDLNSLKNHLGC